MLTARELLDPLLGIVGIVLGAVVLRWLVHRLIARLTDGLAAGRVSSLLRPHRSGSPGTAERRAQRARTVGSLLRSVASFVIFGVAFVLVLSKLGINIAPIIASAGVVGVAVGFGAQNLIKDFLSGIFMMLEDQYGVGDVVDLGDATGTVEMVGLRITTVRDVNGTVWYVRNGTITAVGNSTQRFGVAVVDVPVGYSADVDQAIGIAGEAARQAVTRKPLADEVLGDVETLGAQDLTQAAITLRLTVKTKPGRQWAVRRALTADVKMALDTAGITAAA
ncbi:small conductance mechanosensitive channel [Amycolatopsis bartoniae]|uniref:Mechanosensitive ion channel protein MscS n=1 Tax=Amycolatopsis bartoniae TaxID=941986 RepID=A0A8H9MFH8_9PSEU|nr:mechanosensitive ion channel domain-containing protein [Amycolatopsis bartoniae]MBB2933765.1 small conductance mechanosensitive channel [Amycolatopsis bartoniae]GHF71884.1 mechanosensitive ion channel protein MscS [Amycolatopsis bartoniae]